jgi:two-component system, LuxR family, response regulator FixJ
MTNQTIYLLDDNVAFLDSAQWMLESAGFAVHSFSGHELALKALQQASLDNACLLLDVRMPDMSGLEFHDTLLSLSIKLPVVYMTGHADVPLAVQAMRKGAITFIEKPFAPEALKTALDWAFAIPKSTARINSVLQAEREEFTQRLPKLTNRERQVLDFVVQAQGNKSIARRLGISLKTVEWHRKNGMSKLGVSCGVELTRRMTLAQVN